MDSIRKQEIKTWATWIGCLGAGVGLFWFLRWKLGYDIRGGWIAAVIAVPLVIYYLIDALVSRRSKGGATNDILINYDEFARDEDAIIAPNHPASSAAIAGFIRSYLSRKPKNQVYAVVPPDEKHLASAIFLIGEALTKAEKARMRQWKAEEVAEVSVPTLNSFKSKIDPTGTITRVIWD